MTTWDANLQSAIVDMWKIDSQVASFLGATNTDPHVIAVPPEVIEQLCTWPLQSTNADTLTMRILRLLRTHALAMVQEAVVNADTAEAIAELAERGSQADLETALQLLEGTGSSAFTMLVWQTRALIHATLPPVPSPQAAISTVYVVVRWTYAHYAHRLLVGEDRSLAATATLVDRLKPGH